MRLSQNVSTERGTAHRILRCLCTRCSAGCTSPVPPPLGDMRFPGSRLLPHQLAAHGARHRDTRFLRVPLPDFVATPPPGHAPQNTRPSSVPNIRRGPTRDPAYRTPCLPWQKKRTVLLQLLQLKQPVPDSHLIMLIYTDIGIPVEHFAHLHLHFIAFFDLQERFAE